MLEGSNLNEKQIKRILDALMIKKKTNPQNIRGSSKKKVTSSI